MKILMTGATGFLGSYLLKSLLKKNHEITILKRSYSNIHRIKEVINQIKIYNIDQSGLEKPFKDISKYNAVIHTATLYGRKGESTQDVFAANTQFPMQLLDTATFFNVDTFFNADTIQHKYLNDHTLSKKQFMEWGIQFAAKKKIQFVNIKMRHVYGPLDDDIKLPAYIIKSCLNNVPELRLTLGEQKIDYIYINDVVSAYEALLNKASKNEEYFQEYDLGTGQTVSIKTFVETVHSLTDSKTYLNFGAIPYRENEIMYSCANIEKLIQLGWQPTIDLKTGLKYIIELEKRLN